MSLGKRLDTPSGKKFAARRRGRLQGTVNSEGNIMYRTRIKTANVDVESLWGVMIGNLAPQAEYGLSIKDQEYLTSKLDVLLKDTVNKSDKIKIKVAENPGKDITTVIKERVNVLTEKETIDHLKLVDSIHNYGKIMDQFMENSMESSNDKNKLLERMKDYDNLLNLYTRERRNDEALKKLLEPLLSEITPYIPSEYKEMNTKIIKNILVIKLTNH